MSADSAIVTKSWTVGIRSVTLTIPRPARGKPVFCTMEWSPSEPARLSAVELAQYRAGRHHAIAELAAELDVSVALLEL